MCGAQCILVLMALCVGLVHSSSWDFAAASGSNLEFYLKEQKIFSENLQTGDIRKIAYDPVGNRMFFYDADNKDHYILSYDMKTKKIEPIVLLTDEDERIEGIAFDPVDQKLFWNVYYYSTIYWLSLNLGYQNYYNGIFLLKTSDWGTSTIAIDSCNGYIYWTNIDEGRHKHPSLIERARFDGSQRETIIRFELHMPKHLVVDPQTQRLYWTDGTQETDKRPTEDKHFSIESADLNGKNRTVLHSEAGLDQPKSFAVSEDSIYWSHWHQRNAWQLPKNASKETKSKIISITASDEIVTNYKIEQQFKGVRDCDRVKPLLPKVALAVKNESSTERSVHGTNASGECKPGEINEGLNGSVCYNYCFKGDCCVSGEGQPQCRCNSGYAGIRCEVNLCQGYCLNDGVCSVNDKNAPVCQCRANYEGERCEDPVCLNKCFQRIVSMVWNVINSELTPTTQKQEQKVKSTCAANNF